jgi:hypothetical protein
MQVLYSSLRLGLRCALMSECCPRLDSTHGTAASDPGDYGNHEKRQSPCRYSSARTHSVAQHTQAQHTARTRTRLWPLASQTQLKLKLRTVGQHNLLVSALRRGLGLGLAADCIVWRSFIGSQSLRAARVLEAQRHGVQLDVSQEAPQGTADAAAGARAVCGRAPTRKQHLRMEVPHSRHRSLQRRLLSRQAPLSS